MQAALEDERRRFPIEEVADRTAQEREVVVARKVNHRREVDTPLEPRLHAVDAAAFDLEGMVAVENPEVIVDRLGRPHGGRGGARHATCAATTSAAPADIVA